jgi:hypothetical protein
LTFRRFIKEYKKQYQEARRHEKGIIALEAVLAWRDLDPPGRFLARENPSLADSVWYDVGDELATKRTGRTLGERPPSCRQDSRSDPGTRAKKRKAPPSHASHLPARNHATATSCPSSSPPLDFIASLTSETVSRRSKEVDGIEDEESIGGMLDKVTSCSIPSLREAAFFGNRGALTQQLRIDENVGGASTTAPSCSAPEPPTMNLAQGMDIAFANSAADDYDISTIFDDDDSEAVENGSFLGQKRKLIGGMLPTAEALTSQVFWDGDEKPRGRSL